MTIPWAKACTRVLGYFVMVALVILAGFLAHLVLVLLLFGWRLV